MFKFKKIGQNLNIEDEAKLVIFPRDRRWEVGGKVMRIIRNYTCTA